jgi:hypothetical protein
MGSRNVAPVVLSSTEAEYCGAANTCKEVLAQKQLFKVFQLDFPEQYPVLLDNHQSAIALACGLSSRHQRTKYIATKYHYHSVSYCCRELCVFNTKRRKYKLLIF